MACSWGPSPSTVGPEFKPWLLQARCTCFFLHPPFLFGEIFCGVLHLPHHPHESVRIKTTPDKLQHSNVFIYCSSFIHHIGIDSSLTFMQILLKFVWFTSKLYIQEVSWLLQLQILCKYMLIWLDQNTIGTCYFIINTL